MENVSYFMAQHGLVIYILITAIVFFFIGLLIARAMPPKKPESYGELHIVHYPNGFKELYLRLKESISFENEEQICVDIKNENVDAY